MKTSKATVAVNNRIDEWLPHAETRYEELKTKATNATNPRTRAVMQTQADDLRAQIEAVKRDRNEPTTDAFEQNSRGNIETGMS